MSSVDLSLRVPKLNEKLNNNQESFVAAQKRLKPRKRTIVEHSWTVTHDRAST